jgi:hypothetical protein
MSLAEVRRELLTRRIKLMLRQIDAEAIGHLGSAECFRQEIEAVTLRLRMIDAARAT